MKRTLQFFVPVALIVGIGYLLFTTESTIEYQSERATTTNQFFTPKIEKTDVEKARDMLTEATAKLNAEEEKLLAEIAEVKADAASRVAALEAKLEEINIVRSSF